MGAGFSRRGLLTGAIAAAAGSALGLPSRSGSSRKQNPERLLRIAYITDVHLEVNYRCAKTFVKVLKQINAMDDRPDLIIQGGDLIMDALNRPAISVAHQYGVAREILARHNKIPIQHVIGNHDIWGWNLAAGNDITSDHRYGKRWWLEWTGYTSTYRSFDRKGWHFVLLDSIVPDGRGYAAKLDDAQAAWLAQDLAQTPADMPVCVVSHAPIMSTGAMFFGQGEQQGNWHVPRSLMHIDARWIKDLLVKHPNVKACLSGHIHMQDRIDYNGVKHFGVGAVCGAWWRGPMQETPAQYAIVDFYDNGNAHTTFIKC